MNSPEYIESILSDIKDRILGSDGGVSWDNYKAVDSQMHDSHLQDRRVMSDLHESRTDSLSNGGVELSMNEAMSKLASEIGINDIENESERSAEENRQNLNLKVVSRASAESSVKEEDMISSYDKLVEDSHQKLISPYTEKLILNAAIDEINLRLRSIISSWLEENLPSLIKKTMHEELTRVLKSTNF